MSIPSSYFTEADKVKYSKETSLKSWEGDKILAKGESVALLSGNSIIASSYGNLRVDIENSLGDKGKYNPNLIVAINQEYVDSSGVKRRRVQNISLNENCRDIENKIQNSLKLVKGAKTTLELQNKGEESVNVKDVYFAKSQDVSYSDFEDMLSNLQLDVDSLKGLQDLFKDLNLTGTMPTEEDLKSILDLQSVLDSLQNTISEQTDTKIQEKTPQIIQQVLPTVSTVVGSYIEPRTSDPENPEVGRIWLRVDIR